MAFFAAKSIGVYLYRVEWGVKLSATPRPWVVLEVGGSVDRRFGAVGSDVGRINEVTLRRARLVLGWVTVSGFNSRCGKFISV